MPRIFPGRFTAEVDGPFVVFLIGMRVNKLWAVHKWLPVARAMGPMVKELLAHPELGLLHAELYAYWRGAALVQYWHSFEQLERFAREPAQLHLNAWRRFNQAIGADGRKLNGSGSSFPFRYLSHTPRKILRSLPIQPDRPHPLPRIPSACPCLPGNTFSVAYIWHVRRCLPLPGLTRQLATQPQGACTCRSAICWPRWVGSSRRRRCCRNGVRGDLTQTDSSITKGVRP